VAPLQQEEPKPHALLTWEAGEIMATVGAVAEGRRSEISTERCTLVVRRRRRRISVLHVQRHHHHHD